MPLRSFLQVVFLLATALLWVLFGFFLHQNTNLALASLVASMLIMSHWLWRSTYEELCRTFAFKRAPRSLMISGAALALAMGILLRWLQTHSLYPSPLRSFLLVSMSIGITEELIFRGYFLGRLAVWCRPAAAIVLSSIFHSTYKTAIFISAAPLDELALLGGITFAFGLLLGLWRTKSNSLWPCILFHGLFDLWVYGDRTTPWWVW